MQSNFSLLFYLKKPKNYESGLLPIYLRITVNGERAELSANREVDPNEWNVKAGRMKGNRENVKTLNAYLDLLRSNMYAAQQIILNKEQALTALELKNTYLGKSEKPRYILEIFKEHNQKVNELIGNEFAVGTATRYATSLKHTENFIQWKYRKTDIDIKKIDHDFIISYDFYLRTKRKCNNNSTVKYIKNFKKIVNICLASGWIDKNPFLNYKAKTKQIDRQYLSQDELDRLIKKELSNERLHQVRDIFLFSCYTGLAYADVKKLKANEIVKGIDGERWITTHRTKTLTPSRIPLLPFAVQKIELYKDHPHCCSTGLALPVLSNQKMNAYLKEIADLCGIVKTLTFHIARHTFATTVTLANGVPIETVSKMLGHTTIRMTQHYAKILDISVSKDMALLKDKLNKKPIKPEIAAEPNCHSTIALDDLEILTGTDELPLVNYDQAAKVETSEWIAPLLRESKRYPGLKIAVDSQSFGNYLKYRSESEFNSWEEFHEKGKISTVTIHYLAGTDYGHIRGAFKQLNESEYIQEGKIEIVFQKISGSEDRISWVEV